MFILFFNHLQWFLLNEQKSLFFWGGEGGGNLYIFRKVYYLSVVREADDHLGLLKSRGLVFVLNKSKILNFPLSPCICI